MKTALLTLTLLLAAANGEAASGVLKAGAARLQSVSVPVMNAVALDLQLAAAAAPAADAGYEARPGTAAAVPVQVSSGAIGGALPAESAGAADVKKEADLKPEPQSVPSPQQPAEAPAAAGEQPRLPAGAAAVRNLGITIIF